MRPGWRSGLQQSMPRRIPVTAMRVPRAGEESMQKHDWDEYHRRSAASRRPFHETLTRQREGILKRHRPRSSEDSPLTTYTPRNNDSGAPAPASQSSGDHGGGGRSPQRMRRLSATAAVPSTEITPEAHTATSTPSASSTQSTDSRETISSLTDPELGAITLDNPEIHTESQFSEEYHRQLRQREPARAPTSFMTHYLSQGLRKLVSSPADKSAFLRHCTDQQPDLLIMQGVALECDSERGRTHASAADASVCEQFCALFPNYNFFASLGSHRVEGEGQLVGVKNDCEIPAVTYNLNVPTEANQDSHDKNGRIMALEFPSVMVLSRIAGQTGINVHKKILERAAEDKECHDFIRNKSEISDKPVLYTGNLNVASHLNDMTETPHHWMEYRDPIVTNTPAAADDDAGLSCCTTANRKRFKKMLIDAQMLDLGAKREEDEPLHTEHGARDLVTDTWRTTYACVSVNLVKAECVSSISTPGMQDGRVGHFGSLHSPIMVKLTNQWNHRYKGTRGKVIVEQQPHYKRKVQFRKERLAPFREKAQSRKDNRTCAFITWLKTSACLHAMESSPRMSTGAQYFTTHRDGEIVLPEANGSPAVELRFHSLWDTGASNANYMSSQFYEAHKEQLEPFATKVTSAVTLGDKKTRLNLDTMVVLPVRFTGDDGKQHEAEIPMMVLESDGRDAIIGMPSLITDFGQLFKQMVCKAVDKYAPPEPTFVPDTSYLHLSEVHMQETDMTEASQLFPVEVAETLAEVEKEPPPEGCEYPWSTDFEAECPEDKLIPEAISNDLHLEHLTQSYEAELEKFNTLLISHIDADFLKAEPATLELMRKYRDCFVKREWKGLNLPEILIKFKDTLPSRLKPYTPRIPQQLLGHSEKEFKRMLEYFYVKCDSPWASPLTVAPKATEPFIRLCVNLRKINSYVDFGHFPIPNVKGTLESLLPYKFFCDIDLKSSFHQIPLSKESSEKLSVSTPWGQFRPKFVPEGLCQASQNLQECMTDMFGGMGDWCSLLFDNILIGGKTEAEMVENLGKFLERARKFNVYLKIEKTWIGFKEVKFFGYKVRDGKFYLEDSRAEAIESIPFPASPTLANNLTAMRSFLGQTRIFQPHVPDYTTFAAPLEKLTSLKFDWNKTTWTEDYELIFEQFKAKLKEAMILFMPDFEKEWIMRTDASTTGYGGVLYQVSISEEGKRVYEPLTFISRKWSDPATRWDTFSQECFGIFACVKECAHWLRGKPFIIETDHANLRTMEQSLVPKIIRQHLYLRTFTCWVRHVPGKSNTADYWSRLHNGLNCLDLDLYSLYLSDNTEVPSERKDGTEFEILHNLCRSEDSDPDFWNDATWLERTLCAISKGESSAKPEGVAELKTYNPQELFDTVHGGKMLHQGVRRTWLLLNKLYPAHGIPITRVQDMVEECSTCQKFRLGLRDQLEAMPRVLKPPHHRRTVGVDTLTITPESEDGFKAIITVVNHYTHQVFLYPVKKYDSESLANALMQYISNFGLFDELISDPGSDLTSKAIEELNSWLGLRHVVSLVDVHTSNGCENTNKQIITHLSCLCNDLRIKGKWADPKILALIQMHFNGAVSAETGVSPFKALFGSVDEFYYTLPENTDPVTYMTSYVKRLDDALGQLRKISHAHQGRLMEERLRVSREPNQYQNGDLVLKTVRTPTKHWKPEKIGPQFYGPYRVEGANANDYTVRHVTDGSVHVFHVDMLKPYFGTMAMAKRAALLDHDQYVVTKVTHYVGDPQVRSGMEFLLTFADGDVQWQVFRQELMDNEAFQLYIKSVPELWPLKTTADQFKKQRILLNKQQITEVNPGDVRWVDLRAIGTFWYNGYEGKASDPGLPDEDVTTYVAPFTMTRWKSERNKTKLVVTCPLLDYTCEWNHEMVKSWGTYKEAASSHVVVDEAFLKVHPQLWKSLRSRRPASTPAVAPVTKQKKKLVRRVVKSASKGLGKPVESSTRRTRSSTRLG